MGVLMAINDFMEEQEVFDLLKKKKQRFGVYERITDSLTLFSPTLPGIAVKL